MANFIIREPVKEKGQKEPVKLYLDYHTDGSICLMAEDPEEPDTEGWYILKVTQEGRIELCASVYDDLGFQLDDAERVIVVKEM